MPNPSNIFTYFAEQDGIKRKELNYAELWEAFKQMRSEQPVREPGGFDGGVAPEKVNQYWEADLIKQERL